MITNAPSLRIAVTEKCNLNCPYCPEHGDSYQISGLPLQLRDFRQIIQCAHEEGIRHFSITGGEPLVVPEITFPLSQYIRKLGDIGYLKLNSNGVLVEKEIDKIKEAKFDAIKVSIDSLKPCTYKIASGLPREQNMADVLSGLSLLKRYDQKVRIQTVIAKYNFEEIDAIIDYCNENGFDLKLFDLTYYSDSKTNDKNFWKENYISLEKITDALTSRFGEAQISNSVGGYGHRMKVFRMGTGNTLQVRDSENYAHYAKICEKCGDYPCQDGLCSITLSADGVLKICRPKGINLDLELKGGDGNLLPKNGIKEKFKKALDIFLSAKMCKRSFSAMNCSKLK